MNYHDDREIQRQMFHHSVRAGLWRTAIIWMPLFAVAGGAFLFFLADVLLGGGRGTWFLVIVLGIAAILFGFQGIQAVLDLMATPHEATAEVVRRWSRSDSLVMRSHYIRLDSGQILRGNVVLLDGIKEGDRIKATFYPHSAVLVDVEKLREPEPPPEPEQ